AFAGLEASDVIGDLAVEHAVTIGAEQDEAAPGGEIEPCDRGSQGVVLGAPVAVVSHHLGVAQGQERGAEPGMKVVQRESLHAPEHGMRKEFARTGAGWVAGADRTGGGALRGDCGCPASGSTLRQRRAGRDGQETIHREDYSVAKADSQHRWRFFRAGGLDQVRFHTAEDYRRLKDLDQKLWVALAWPVRGLELDERTLALIDSDGDGRVRAPEVIAAVQWMDDRIKDLAALKDGS